MERGSGRIKYLSRACFRLVKSGGLIRGTVFGRTEIEAENDAADTDLGAIFQYR